MEYYVKSVISIIESNYHKLTSAEKTVADFFIHNNQNTDFSSSHIAELLYTSKATLSRFAKKIGYRGYQEFIYQYENTFEEKEEKITGNTKIVLNAYQEVLNKTYNLVDEAQIGRIVGYLNKADRVLVCGCGSSGLSAKEMEIRFMRIGIDVDSMTDSDMIKMASVFQNRRSLIFGFSIKANYYYRLRRVRKACLDQMQTEQADFIELPMPSEKNISADTENVSDSIPAIRIKTKEGVSFEVFSNVSTEVLKYLIEVVIHAE